MQAKLNETHVGRFVAVRTWGTWGQSVVTGKYAGVIPSEWDEAPVHFFNGGDINGTGQPVHAFPEEREHYVVSVT